MCGIIGYVGRRPAVPLLLQGLRRLEYRGYDSAGIAVVRDGDLVVRKCAGRISQLESLLTSEPIAGSSGIGHTRWATHGPPNDVNAHPHLGGDGLVALVHNGVIENARQIKAAYVARGVRFRSETDSEVIAHLLAEEVTTCVGSGAAPASPDALLDVVTGALRRLAGTYAVALLIQGHPHLLLAGRRGSPLVLGRSEGEHFVASDSGALVGLAREVVVLRDDEYAFLTPERAMVVDGRGTPVRPRAEALSPVAAGTDQGAYPHHMLREIFEQPATIAQAMRDRFDKRNAAVRFPELGERVPLLRDARRLIITGCGTSFNAGLVGEYLIEGLACVPVEVEYASEFRYRNPPIVEGTLLLALSQSGETADTLAALRESKRRGIPTFAICNVVGSSMAREADATLSLHAGPELGVASTKAFTAQLTVLTLLALFLGQTRRLAARDASATIAALRGLPDVVRRVLELDDAVRRIAERYASVTNALYLGRHLNYPIALEGALKLKEVSYIHAEGYPAAEMKHGPIALVDARTPSVFLVPQGAVYEKVLSNLEEIKARGGPVIAIASEGDEEIPRRADDALFVPRVPEILQPIVTVIPLQLLAYHIAVLRGHDVDKPRNLAKSVTVE